MKELEKLHADRVSSVFATDLKGRDREIEVNTNNITGKVNVWGKRRARAKRSERFKGFRSSLHLFIPLIPLATLAPPPRSSDTPNPSLKKSAKSPNPVKP